MRTDSERRLLGASLIAVLVLVYSSSFLSDYLINDEVANVGQPWAPGLLATHHFLTHGRALEGVFCALVYEAVGLEPVRIRLIRLTTVLAQAVFSALMFSWIARRQRSPREAFLLALFLSCQRGVESAMGYSLQNFHNIVPAMWLSVGAYWLHFEGSSDRRRWLRRVGVIVLLIMALQAHPTYGLFAVVPATWMILDDWARVGTLVGEFLFLCLLAFVAAASAETIALMVLHHRGELGYFRGETLFAALRDHPLRMIVGALNPSRYWSAFVCWSFPFPLNQWRLGLTARRVLATCIMAAWGLALSLAARSQWKRGSMLERKQVVQRWLAVLACFAFGSLCIIADGPLEDVDHRPHISAVANGVAVLSGYYALHVVVSELSVGAQRILRYLWIVLVAMAALGAQAVVAEGMVAPAVAELQFIRTQLAARDPMTYRRVVVILPATDPGCGSPPCEPYVGSLVQGEWHEEQEGRYRYALHTLGIDADSKKFLFVRGTPPIVSDDDVLVDWTQFVRAHRRDLTNHGH